jgi:hypothetical protein
MVGLLQIPAMHPLRTTPLLVLLAAAGATVAPNPPRVLIFSLGDDYGFNNVGYPHGPRGYANPEARTPTLDRLALEGVRLERHYVYKSASPSALLLLLPPPRATESECFSLLLRSLTVWH